MALVREEDSHSIPFSQPVVSACRCIVIRSVLTALPCRYRLKLEDHLSPTDMWDFRCMSHEQLAKELTRRVEGPAAGMIVRQLATAFAVTIILSRK